MKEDIECIFVIALLRRFEFGSNLNGDKNLLESLKMIKVKSVILGMDFNARSTEWAMPSTNRRGRAVLDMAARQWPKLDPGRDFHL